MWKRIIKRGSSCLSSIFSNTEKNVKESLVVTRLLPFSKKEGCVECSSLDSIAMCEQGYVAISALTPESLQLFIAGEAAVKF